VWAIVVAFTATSWRIANILIVENDTNCVAFPDVTNGDQPMFSSWPPLELAVVHLFAWISHRSPTA